MKIKNKEKNYNEFFRGAFQPVYKKKIETAEQRKESLKGLKELNDFFSDENKQLSIW